MDIKKIINNEYIFSTLTKIIMVGIGFVESILMARFLGASLRGELAYIYSMASTIFFILTFGIYTAYPFKRKEKSINNVVLLNEYMTMIIVLFSFYFVLDTIICIYVFRVSSTWGLILLLLPVMGFDKVVSFVYMIENPNKMNFVTLIATITQCTYLILMYLIAKPSIFAGVFYYLLGCCVKSVYFTRKLNFEFKISRFSFKVLIGYIKFGFFPMVALLLTTLNYRVDVVMLKSFDYISMAQVGIYSIGIGLSEKALMVPDAIKEVLLSKLAKGSGKNEVAKVMRICFFTSLVTAVFINVFAKLVVRYLYGSEYSGAEIITYISVWGTTVMVFFKMISQYNVIEHKQHFNVIFLAVSIVVNVFLNYFLIPVFGIKGAAIATVIGYAVSSSLFIVYFKKMTHIPVSKMIFIQKKDLELLKSFIRK